MAREEGPSRCGCRQDRHPSLTGHRRRLSVSQPHAVLGDHPPAPERYNRTADFPPPERQGNASTTARRIPERDARRNAGGVIRCGLPIPPDSSRLSGRLVSQQTEKDSPGCAHARTAIVSIMDELCKIPAGSNGHAFSAFRSCQYVSEVSTNPGRPSSPFGRGAARCPCSACQNVFVLYRPRPRVTPTGIHPETR